MNNQSVLVTGATGFIGSHLTARLVKLGYSTHVIVRPQSNLLRLQQLASKIRFHSLNLTNHKQVKRTAVEIKPQLIFHLAGYGVQTYADISSDNTRTILLSNIQGTFSLLQAAADLNSLKAFVHTGSCFEYGSREQSFLETDPLSPVNIYGASKASSTFIAKAYANNFNIPIIILRPFTVYGPWENPTRFISTTIRRCLSGLNPQVTRQKIIRDYVYIDDLVEGYILAAKFAPKLKGNILNISTGIGTTTEQIAKIIIAKVGNINLKPEIGSFPQRIGEVLTLIGNPAQAKKTINWKAKTALEIGIQQTLDWIKQTA